MTAPYPSRPVVLVVDDSAAVRHYICELLKSDDCEVAEASDGAECLTQLGQIDPDVVVLDVEMPGKSGLQVLSEIGLNPRLFSVILCTTRSSEQDIALGLDLGADDYIVKPFSDSDLRARVRAGIRSARQKRALAQAHREVEQAMAQLRQAQSRLLEQEKVGAVARLAAGAAHHINNPLGFVMSNISTLGRYACALTEHADQLGKALTELGGEEALRESEKNLRIRQVRKDLPFLVQETKEGGMRIALIVQQLAQLELGFLTQESAEIDLVPLVGTLVRMAQDLAPDGTKVQWIHPEDPVAIKGSLSLLNAALLAVLKNACEALGTRPGSICIKLSATDETCRIAIVDSGAGIPEYGADSIFEPFYSTKAPETHAGLGLTIAQAFVASQGGNISVSSRPGATSVRIEFPRLAAATLVPGCAESAEVAVE